MERFDANSSGYATADPVNNTTKFNPLNNGLDPTRLVSLRLTKDKFLFFLVTSKVYKTNEI